MMLTFDQARAVALAAVKSLPGNTPPDLVAATWGLEDSGTFGVLIESWRVLVGLDTDVVGSPIWIVDKSTGAVEMGGAYSTDMAKYDAMSTVGMPPPDDLTELDGYVKAHPVESFAI